MGVTQGRASREVLTRLHDAVLELLDVPTGGGFSRVAAGASRWMVPAVGVVARRMIARDLKAHYPRHYDRMCGIAAGAGVPLHWLFVGPGVELLLNHPSVRRPVGACTALGVTGARARRGEPMIAKNFDYPDAARATYMVRVSRPRRRGLAASIDVTNAPLAGSHEGINEHGLAMAYNYGHFKGSPGARVSITTLAQELLEECRTVDDALDRLQRRPRAGSAILMLADAGGALASVEVAPDAIAVRRGDALAHANHAVCDDMVDRDIPHDAVLSRWNPGPVRGARVHESSEHRHRRAAELLDDAGAVSERDLERFIADHDGKDGCDDHTICRRGPYYQTTCAVQLFPQRRTLKVMFDSPCRGTWTVVSL